MENVLPYIYDNDIPQKDAWICLASKGMKDVDVRVYRREDDLNFCSRIFSKIEPGYSPSDIGNTLSGWEEWSLADILFKFGFQYDFDNDLKIRSLKELRRISEWKKQIEGYLYFIGIKIDD